MSINPAAAVFLREFVRRRAAIVIEADQEYLLETRLASLAESAGFKHIDELALALQNKTAVHLETAVVEALTTNETSFFRDLAPFEVLRRKILPTLLERRGPARALTIWCAACSTGQEPYSIAMLICEHFPQILGWNLRIIATDLSNPTLARAQEGRYRQIEVNRGLPAPLLLKYFDRNGTEWVIKPSIKRLVEFSQMNLIEAWKIPRSTDIVFLRNVLIYFDNKSKKSILERVRSIIAPDGALMLGATETTLNIDQDWIRDPAEKAVYYQLRK